MCKYLAYTRKEGDCLVWTRCLNTDGYPRANIRGNSNGKVHREVFYEFNGHYPPVVRHTCDNPTCINPDHLVGGTPRDNMKDRSERGRTYGHVTKDEATKAVKLRESGKTYKEISQCLGVKPKRVEYILTKLAE